MAHDNRCSKLIFLSSSWTVALTLGVSACGGGASKVAPRDAVADFPGTGGRVDTGDASRDVPATDVPVDGSTPSGGSNGGSGAGTGGAAGHGGFGGSRGGRGGNVGVPVGGRGGAGGTQTGGGPPDGGVDGPRDVSSDSSQDGAQDDARDSAVDAPPVYGIATRPVNSTCLAPALAADMPSLLSKTGCVDPQNPTKPAAGLIPYDVRSPLWSDGAEKRRYFALPEGGRIHINASGDWDFPNGTVLMKSFLLGGKLIETRLLVRLTGGDGGASAGQWSGYSFQWDDGQTEATLMSFTVTKDFTVDNVTQTWLYPSSRQCNQCHLEVAGFSLGLETAQLNGDMAYPGGTVANQLATLDHLGLFDVPLSAPVSQLPALATPTGPESVETRARSYLHANCSMCHRPGADSTFGAALDLRYTATFKETGLCSAVPLKGNVGVTGALLLAPGDPSKSVVVLRPSTLVDSLRMPPLASSVVHKAGVALLETWVSGVTTCP